MARSFDVVDYKLAEAEFFLKNFKNAKRNFFAGQCYFSAFVSSARSVTFSLQAVMGGNLEFKKWYAEKQDQLNRNKYSKILCPY